MNDRTKSTKLLHQIPRVEKMTLHQSPTFIFSFFFTAIESTETKRNGKLKKSNSHSSVMNVRIESGQNYVIRFPELEKMALRQLLINRHKRKIYI